jgi:formylglycine-generating enzyme
MSRSQLYRFAAAALAIATSGCTYNPRIPEGVVACTDTIDCPDGYFCAVAAADPTSRVCCVTAACGASGDGGADRPLIEAGEGTPDLPRDVVGPPDADVGFTPEPDAPIDAPLPPDARLPDARLPDVAPDVTPDVTVPPDAMSLCPPYSGGPAMVRAGSFCVDSTEVTNAQYEPFLAAKGGDVSGQPNACKWNLSYRPSSETVIWPYTDRTKDHPVVNVDWCDAYMFCKWAGKRLCGKIGGGRLGTWEASTRPAESQWAAACTGGARTAYPYGNGFDREICNLKAASETATAIEPVKTHTRCEGGYPGIFDISGNVMEWVDACDRDTGEDDLCSSAGSSAWIGTLPPGDLTCAESPYGAAREDAYYLRGFRCCSE